MTPDVLIQQIRIEPVRSTDARASDHSHTSPFLQQAWTCLKWPIVIFAAVVFLQLAYHVHSYTLQSSSSHTDAHGHSIPQSLGSFLPALKPQREVVWPEGQFSDLHTGEHSARVAKAERERKLRIQRQTEGASLSATTIASSNDCTCASAYLDHSARYHQPVRIDPADTHAFVWWNPRMLFHDQREGYGFVRTAATTTDASPPAPIAIESCTFTIQTTPSTQRVDLTWAQRHMPVVFDGLEEAVIYRLTIQAMCDGQAFEYVAPLPYGFSPVSQYSAFQLERTNLRSYLDSVHQAAHSCPATCFHPSDSTVDGGETDERANDWHPFLGKIHMEDMHVSGSDGSFASISSHAIPRRKLTGFDRAMDPTICSEPFWQEVAEYAAWHRQVRMDSMAVFKQHGSNIEGALKAWQSLREKGVKFLQSTQMPQSGMSDRITNSVSTFWVALVTKRIFLLDADVNWQEWNSLVVPSILWDVERAFPWIALLPEKDDQGNSLRFRLLDTPEYRPTSEDYSVSHPDPFISWRSNRGFLHRSIDLSAYEAWFRRLALGYGSAYGCMQHALFQVRVGVVQEREYAGYIATLLNPTLFSVAIHVRVGDAAMKVGGNDGSEKGDSPERFHENYGFFRCASDLSESTEAREKQAAVWFLSSDSQYVKRMAMERWGARARLIGSSISPSTADDRRHRSLTLQMQSFRASPPLGFDPRHPDADDADVPRVAAVSGNVNGLPIATGPILFTSHIAPGHTTLVKDDGISSPSDQLKRERSATRYRTARESMVETFLLGLADHFIFQGESSFARLPAYSSLHMRPVYTMFQAEHHNRAGLKQCLRAQDATDLHRHAADDRTAQV